jgi:hypothetical protein
MDSKLKLLYGKILLTKSEDNIVIIPCKGDDELDQERDAKDIF